MMVLNRCKMKESMVPMAACPCSAAALSCSLWSSIQRRRNATMPFINLKLPPLKNRGFRVIKCKNLEPNRIPDKLHDVFQDFTMWSALRSFHVTRLWKVFPVRLSHVVNVPRCVAKPKTRTSDAVAFISVKAKHYKLNQENCLKILVIISIDLQRKFKKKTKTF